MKKEYVDNVVLWGKKTNYICIKFNISYNVTMRICIPVFGFIMSGGMKISDEEN